MQEGIERVVKAGGLRRWRIRSAWRGAVARDGHEEPRMSRGDARDGFARA